MLLAARTQPPKSGTKRGDTKGVEAKFRGGFSTSAAPVGLDFLKFEAMSRGVDVVGGLEAPAEALILRRPRGSP